MSAYTWLGTTNQSMDVPTNWNPNGIPTAADTAAYGGGAVRTIANGTCLAPFTHIFGGTIGGGTFMADIINTAGGVIKGNVRCYGKIKIGTVTGGYYLYGQGGPITIPASLRSLFGSRTPPKILFMDDIYNSGLDGPNGLILLNWLQQLGYCKIIAAVCETNYLIGLKMLDAINTYYGHGDIPIGVYNYAGLNNEAPTGNYAGLISSCTRTHAGFDASFDSVAVMRQALHNADDGSVTLHSTGPLCSLAALLASSADSIDARSGADLVAAKVCAFQCGSGNYPVSTTEQLTNFNITMVCPDAITAGHAALEAWKSAPLSNIPIVYAGEDATAIDVTGTSQDIISVRGGNQWPSTVPAYWLWQQEDAIEATDIVRAFYVIFGEQTYWTRSNVGVNTVNLEDGTNSFAETAGAHQQYLSVPSGANQIILSNLLRDLLIRAAAGTGGDDHTLVANVAPPASVLVGHDNYLGGEHGTATAITSAETIADAILARDVAHAETLAPRNSLATIILALANRANTTVHTNKLTVYRTDGETEHCQIPLTTNPTANPIVGIG